MTKNVFKKIAALVIMAVMVVTAVPAGIQAIGTVTAEAKTKKPSMITMKTVTENELSNIAATMGSHNIGKYYITLADNWGFNIDTKMYNKYSGKLYKDDRHIKTIKMSKAVYQKAYKLGNVYRNRKVNLYADNTLSIAPENADGKPEKIKNLRAFVGGMNDSWYLEATLKWDHAKNATGYDIQIYGLDYGNVKNYSTSKNGIRLKLDLDEGFSENKIKIRSKNSNGKSAWTTIAWS